MEGRQRMLPPILDVSTSDLEAPSPLSANTDTNQKPDDPKLQRYESRLSDRTSKTSKERFDIKSISRKVKSPFSDFVNTLQIVQCPICAELMNTPKLLPCLHSFCKKCLHGHIMTELREDIQKDRKVDNFHCPVCKERTAAPSVPYKLDNGCEKWAAHFPTNFFLHAYGMILAVMNGEVDCDPCFRRGETTLATWWCCECSEYQCNVCKTVHGGFKPFKHHGVIPVKDIAQSPDLAVPRYEPCAEHREKITKYCQGHRVACCSSCLATDHRKCDGIVSIDEQFDAIKVRGDVLEIVTLLKTYEATTVEMGEYQQKVLDNVEAKRQEIRETVQLIREGFERDLKLLEKNLLEDLDEFHAKEVNELNKLKSEIENLQKQITNTLSLVETVEKLGSKTHVVTTFDRVTPVCEKYDRVLRRSQDTLKNVIYSFDIDPSLANVFKTIKQFGNISVKRTDQSPQNLGIAKHVPRGKAVEMYRLSIQMAGDRGRCGIMGGHYFRDGRILLADHDNFKLKLFNEDGRKLGKLVLKGKPSDLATIDEETFAVTYPSASGMQLIHMTGNVLREGNFINTQRIYHGISYCDGKLYLVANNRIAVTDTAGNEQHFLKLQEKGVSLLKAARHIKATPNVLYVTDPEKNVVVALSSSGQHLYTISAKDMSYPFGLDLDDYGDVFVCCKTSSTVHHFTSGGERVGVLLTEKDGLESPLIVRFQRFYNKFFVTESKGENRDYIRIFHWI